MREVSIKVWDDLDWANDETRNEAVVTVTLGFQGNWVELDLSEVNHTRLQVLLGDYLNAGHPPDGPVTTPRGPQAGRKTPEFEYGKALREFANEAGIRYRTKTGKYYYSKKLTDAFEKHLAEQGNTALADTYRAHLAGKGQKGAMT
jgi:Lsr2